MVSDTRTEFAEGTVQWKPDPKERDGKDGPWISYQVQIDDVYYDCNKKVYDATQKGDNIRFTYTIRHYKKRDDTEGTRYKISNISGPTTLHDTIAPQTASQPRPATPSTGMIGNLPGAEIGAMENRAWQEAMRIAAIKGRPSAGEQFGIQDEVYQSLLMQQARMGSWFKAQQIPSVGNESQEERQASGDRGGMSEDADNQFKDKHFDSPPWEGDEPPDDLAQEPEAHRDE